ncbi:hypothetical protein F4823DRAFT_562123 [Ustulina deusta]|nr:hypothetical protein F4823DRAFT_562123 [Ustulina deusta]
MEERVKELLGLQEQIFLERYKQASRKVGIVMKTLGLSFRFPIILQLVTLYPKYVAFDRWENMSVLQELKPSKTDSHGRPTDTDTSSVAPGDLQALLVIAVLVGSECKLAAVRQGWREGDAITAREFSHWTAIAYNRDAAEFLHSGVREFLNDFDACVQSGNREENVFRSVVLLTSHFAMLENKEPQPIEYFS